MLKVFFCFKLICDVYYYLEVLVFPGDFTFLALVNKLINYFKAMILISIYFLMTFIADYLA